MDPGIVGLRGEPWDKNLVFDGVVAGSTMTGSDGTFSSEFDKSSVAGLLLDREPEVFFRVFCGSQLVASTERSILRNAKARETPVQLEVTSQLVHSSQPGPSELPVSSVATYHVVRQLRNQATGEPLASFTVWALDLDVGAKRKDLGYDITNEQGFFTISYSLPRAYLPEGGTLSGNYSPVIDNGLTKSLSMHTYPERVSVICSDAS